MSTKPRELPDGSPCISVPNVDMGGGSKRIVEVTCGWSLVQLEVKVAVEVAAHELVNLLLARRVQVLAERKGQAIQERSLSATFC